MLGAFRRTLGRMHLLVRLPFRGVGGGATNRVLKDADGSRVREVTIGAGQFDLGRVAVDFGDAINPNVAAAMSAVYPGDTVRSTKTGTGSPARSRARRPCRLPCRLPCGPGSPNRLSTRST